MLGNAGMRDVSTIDCTDIQGSQDRRLFQTKFSVRSGGHSPNPGWSSINDTGILIDLQKMNRLTLSSDSAVVSLGPGLRWGDVYNALDPYGVSVIGGRIPHVGVAGLILGGAFFHFSGEYGLAADNVKNFEIVLADGIIANANAQKNTDLFWAFLGGGPKFGDLHSFWPSQVCDFDIVPELSLGLIFTRFQ